MFLQWKQCFTIFFGNLIGPPKQILHRLAVEKSKSLSEKMEDRNSSKVELVSNIFKVGLREGSVLKEKSTQNIHIHTHADKHRNIFISLPERSGWLPSKPVPLQEPFLNGLHD